MAILNGTDVKVYSASGTLVAYAQTASITREAFVIKWGNTGAATGDIFYTGSAFLTSFSATGGTEDTATYSLGFTGTAGITIDVS